MGVHQYELHKMYPLAFDIQPYVDKKLIKVKEYPEGHEFENYRVLKYTARAFKKGVWDENLVNCRGTVIDQNNNIVLLPFTKTFNFGEKGVGGKKTLVNRDVPVISVEKINGFMASVTKLKDEILLYATTGTLDSDFVGMAKEKIGDLDDLPFGMTLLFEVCHENDPHIVTEDVGAYLIGARMNKIGSLLYSERVLDELADDFGVMRPKWTEYNSFDKAKKDADNSEREGVMIRSLFGDHLCKIKSKHYLTKKFLMRGRPDKIWNGQVDEDFTYIVDYIKNTYTQEQWSEINEQDRRGIVEHALG